MIFLILNPLDHISIWKISIQHNKKYHKKWTQKSYPKFPNSKNHTIKLKNQSIKNPCETPKFIIVYNHQSVHHFFVNKKDGQSIFCRFKSQHKQSVIYSHIIFRLSLPHTLSGRPSCFVLRFRTEMI
jgi:hypothetical protein